MHGVCPFRQKYTFYKSFVGKKGNTFPDWLGVDPSCKKAMFIEKNNAEKSLVAGTLIGKINTEFSSKVEDCEPHYLTHSANKALPSSKAQEAIIEWINLGAKND